MIYRFFKKFKKLICLVIIICVIVPLASACGNVDNGLTEHKQNSKIGVGGNINAYTTYRSAPLKMMTRKLYYSYLMNYRPFILVVVSDDAVTLDSDGNVTALNDNHEMIMSAASGVFPYKSDYSGYSNHDLKLLLYYVTITEFKSWENDAADDDNFVSKAYDFISPGGSVSIEESEEYSPRKFRCNKIVNMGGNLSDNSNTNRDTVISPVACDLNGGSDSIYNVGTGANQEKGIILLYGEGSLEGFIRDSDIKGGYSSLNTNAYISRIKSLVPNNYHYLLDMFKEISGNELNAKYSAREGYKVLFDVSLQSRINKINEFTKLDFTNNTDSFNTQYLLSDYKMQEVDNDVMTKALNGSEDFKDKSYVTLVTADGFIFERGDIVSDGVMGTLSAAYALVLEELMRMDACPNETVTKVVLDVLSTGAIIAGGAILVATLFVTPIPGARIVGAALLLAGLIYKAVQSGAAASDVNYCEVYEDVLLKLKEEATFAVPVISSHIAKDPGNRTVYFCNKIGVSYEECPKSNQVDLYYYADTEKASNMKLSGMPYLGFYHEGKLVDSISGIADPTFMSEILSSWGILVSTDNKYFASYDEKRSTLTIADRGRTDNTRDSISYCYTLEYNGECIDNDTYSFTAGNLDFKNNGYSLSQTVNDDLYSYLSNRYAGEMGKYNLNVNDYYNQIENASSNTKILQILDELSDEFNQTYYANSKEEAQSRINRIKTRSNELENVIDVSTFTNISNNKKIPVIGNLVTLEKRIFTFNSSSKTLTEQVTGSEIIYIDANNTCVVSGVTYEFSVENGIPFDYQKTLVLEKFKDELNGFTYFTYEVPTFLKIDVNEHFNLPANHATVKDETNNKPCSDTDIRINKIWGNYMCVTDLKWYHIKSNWVEPSKESQIQRVSTTINTEYINYYLGLTINIS